MLSESGEEVLIKLESTTKEATRLQVETLQSILQHNYGVRYLQRHLRGYNAPIDVSTYRRALPLSSYEDYSDEINQLSDGHLDHNPPLLSVDPLVCFFYSTGTSSMKPKLIPYYDSSLSKAAFQLAQLGSVAIHRRLFPPRPSATKILWFMYAGIITVTKGGLKVMAASSYPFHNSSNANMSLFTFTASPREVFLGSNVEHQMYCHLLCGLGNSKFIDGIRAPYAIGLIRVFNLLQSKWEQLCDDLENGFPCLEISDAAMRSSVTKVLGGPQPELSKRFRSIFQGENWGGIVMKLWPNVRYVQCVTTGIMEQYYPKLKYYAQEVPLLGGDYYASECCVGINLDIMQPPETTRFVMLPTAAYFEFLPYDPNKTDATTSEETVDFSSVEVGKMYEVIVTTFSRLYRYRLGDIVRIVGFYNLAPQVEFVMRAPRALSDIITERDLMSAMECFHLALRNEMAVEITEFASFLDLNLNPKRLKIFVEVRKECTFKQEKLQESIVVLRRICSDIENNLGGLYKVQRGRGEAGSLLVTIIKPGSFETLSQVAIENGTPASQYKPPKIIRNHEIVHILEGSAIVTVCSDLVE